MIIRILQALFLATLVSAESIAQSDSVGRRDTTSIVVDSTRALSTSSPAGPEIEVLTLKAQLDSLRLTRLRDSVARNTKFEFESGRLRLEGFPIWVVLLFGIVGLGIAYFGVQNARESSGLLLLGTAVLIIAGFTAGNWWARRGIGSEVTSIERTVRESLRSEGMRNMPDEPSSIRVQPQSAPNPVAARPPVLNRGMLWAIIVGSLLLLGGGLLVLFSYLSNRRRLFMQEVSELRRNFEEDRNRFEQTRVDPREVHELRMRLEENGSRMERILEETRVEVTQAMRAMRVMEQKMYEADARVSSALERVHREAHPEPPRLDMG